MTPCIGVCSTALGDSVCRGCKRYAHEVIHWNSYSDSQKRTIARRLDGFLVQVVSNKIRVINQDLLEWQLQTQRIRYHAHQAPEIWVFALLRAGAQQIRQPADFGLEVDAEFLDTPLLELKDMIDREFYILSEAHYDRYMRIV